MNTKKLPQLFKTHLLLLMAMLMSGLMANATCSITLTPIVHNALCYGDSSGSVILTASGGSAPYHYKNGVHGTLQTANVFNNLYAGVDTFYVTDNLGCSQSVVATVGQSPMVDFGYIVANPTCAGGTDGNIFISGVSGGIGNNYSYFQLGNYSNLDQNLYAGTYWISVYDSVGCFSTQMVNLYDPLPLQLNVDAIIPATGAGSNGSITEIVINGTAPYTYSWSPSGTVQNNSDTTSNTHLSAGNYGLTVTDANGCTSADYQTVTSIACPAISLTDSIFPTGCAGSNVGEVYLSAYNGTAPYSYTNGIHGTAQSSSDFSGLPAGIDTFYVRDANGCKASIIATVPVNTGYTFTPTVSITAGRTQVCGSVIDTFRSTNTFGGTSPTYQWYKNGVAITGATSSTYAGSVHAGDSIYVIMSSSIQCTVPSLVSSNMIILGATNLTPSVSITGLSQICFGLTDTFRAVPVNGGTAPTYQWYNNGVLASGVTGPVYTSNSFTALDSIKVIMTSSAACVSTSTASSVFYVSNSTSVPTISATASTTQVCGSTIVTLTAASTYGGPTPGYQWYLNGTAINSGAAMQATYVTTTLQPGDSIWARLISSQVCVSPNVVYSNHIHITQSTYTPSVSISGNNQVCDGQSDTLHAVPVNGGTAPTYQWYKNGVLVSGVTGATYVLSNFAGQLDSIAVVMTSNAACVSPATATSGIFLAHSNTLLVPSVTATASTTQICGSTPDTLTANIGNGGWSPSYQWYKNGVAITGATQSQYITSSLLITDSVWVVATSSYACVTAHSVTSNHLHFTLSGSTPSVTVSGTTSFCSNTLTTDTFRATPTLGGTAPTYVWYKNGVVQTSATGATYVATSFANGDSIWVVMTSNSPCASPTTATSAHLHLTITSSALMTIGSNSPVASGATISLTSSASGATSYSWTGPNGFTSTTQNPSIPGATVAMSGVYHAHAAINSSSCGANGLVTVVVNAPACNITLTDSVTPASCSIFANGSIKVFAAGGTAPYQYKKGVNGTWQTSNIFSPLLPGVDTIYVKDTVCSTYIVATVGSQGSTITPSVTITASATQLACSGNVDTFRAAQTNGGLSPSYQWYKNGIPISGATSATYIGSGFAYGDSIYVRMTSSNACASPSSALSNVIRVFVSGTTVTPSVSVSASLTQLCSGTVVDTFRATPTNGGTSPTYQWYKNGVAISGATSATYVGSGFANGDSIFVRMVSNVPCAINTTVYSNSIKLTIGNVVPSVTITGPLTWNCNYYSDTFYTHPVNGGSAPTYVWYKNGVALTTSFPYNQLWNTPIVNGDSIWVVMTSNSSCAVPVTATSNHIRVTLTPVVPQVTAYSSDSTLCNYAPTDSIVFYAYANANGGTYPTYQWYRNGVAISGATSYNYDAVVSSIHSTDSIWVVMTSNANCASPASVSSNHIKFTTTVVPSVSLSAVSFNLCSLSVYGDTIYANPVNGGSIPTYQWYVNGTLVTGYNWENTFYPPSLYAGDSVWVVMTSNSACASPTAVTSAHIHLTATTVPASVSITGVTQICGSTQDTFYATPVNGGTYPNYQWYKNGVAVSGATVSVYTGSFAPGDSIWVTMTSTLSCASPATAVSNHIRLSTGTITPSVAVSVANGSPCTGTVDSFTAIPTNGGTAPTYQWYKNGVAISGATSAKYITTSFASTDSFWVVMTSNLSCASPSSVSSTHIHLNVFTAGTVTVTSNSPVSLGATITLSAATVSGATLYSWTGPSGFTATGQTPTRAGATAAMGGTYYVHVTNTTSCGANGSVVVVVNGTSCNLSLTDTITNAGCSFTSGAVKVVAAGGTAPYQYKNGINGTWTTANTFTGLSPATDTFYVKDNAGCNSYIVATVGRTGSYPTVAPTSNSPITAGGTLNLTAHATGSVSHYSWTGPNGFTSTAANPSIVNATTAAGGTYHVTVTNSTSCGSNGAVTVVVNPSTGCNMTLTDSITPVGCQVNSGVVKVYAAGGVSPYQYKNGINGTVQASNVFTGQYQGVDTIYVTDATGCTKSIVANITRPTNMGYPTVTATSNSPVNIGGTINLHATYTGNIGLSNGALLWTGPGIPSAQQNLPNVTISPATTANNATYTVLVYDTTTSCTARSTVSVVINTSSCNIQLRDSITPVGCAYNSGVVRIYATGGTAPYKYKNGINGAWQYSNVFSGLTAGTDTFYVKDTVTCSQSIVASVIRTGTYPTTAPSSNTPVVPGGAINLSSNAPSATSYSWTGPNGYTSTAANPVLTPATVAMTGTYYLTVANVSGCTAIGSTYVFVGASNCNITLTDSVTNNTCFYSRDAKVKLFASGGTAPYKYKKGINGTLQYSNLFTGLWINRDTFYVVDTNNCSKSIIAQPTEPSYISNTLQINEPSGGLNNGSLYVFSRGGVGTNYTYHWSTGANGYSISNLAPGNYCVTATDQTGCTTSICDSLYSTTPANSAPLTLYLDTVTSSSGQTATVHVRVKNFKHIVTAQATVQFDPSVVTYSSVSQSAIASLTAGNFGTTTAAAGKVSFSWFDPTLAGVTLADGTILFAVNFNVIGTGGQFSPVLLGDSPTVREFDDTSLAPIASVTYPGRINVSNNISISGQLRSWYVTNGIRNATVALRGTPNATTFSDINGNYSFNNVLQGSADTITPSKNNDSLRTNGVTTLDVVQVQHQVLGTYQLSGPYALIAADVNGSGSITTSDYAQIQALILGNITTFTGNKLWSFVPTSYVFSNPQSPWGFPTSRYYTAANTTASQTAQDFIGIKLGDVTGDWNPALARVRSTGDSVVLYMPEQNVDVNDTNVLIPVRCVGCNGIMGFQYTVQWDANALAFTGIDSRGYAGGVAYGAGQASSGTLALSWIEQTGGTLYVPDDSVLFYLKFSAVGARGDSSYVSIDSAQMPIEMIDSNFNLMPTAVMSGKVKIKNNTGISNVSAEDMISIHPNPSNSRVIVEVSAPGSEIMITDISGKEVYTATSAGTNVSVSTQSWAAGVYTVSVKLADITKNIKLVVMH